ncbi:MAG: beta-glucuronidase [Bacteroidaceae bacterium]|nr:beta-glucuronidase [Bacteroidaceae bacterium]
MKRFFLLFVLLFGAAQLAWFRPAYASGLPRPEYPRPQFQRAEWQNLNGTWTYAFDFSQSGDEKDWAKSQGFDGKILVPFCPESSLSGIGFTDFIPCIWYQRPISVPAGWAGRRTLLHFGAVDYEASIFINGKFIQTHFGTGSSFELDITPYVQAGQTANLVVRVRDDLRASHQPGGKQSKSLHSQGCLYTRTTGIWQTVWMEPVAPTALRRVFAIPDIDQQQLVVRPEFYQADNGATLTAQLFDGKRLVATATVPATDASTLVLPVKKAKLWSPESPFLYDLRYTVRDAQGQVVDEVTSYVGMRKVHVQDGYFCLNNQPYFQRLVLDQGFYPDGIWTAPSDEALRRDIELAKAVGFNGARLHQKAFEERYYYWADRLGYLTWGEQASWGLDENSDLSARNFLSEWTELLLRDRNHPSLVIWTPFNETWGCRDGAYQRMMRDVYDLTHAVDPTRPVNDASGDAHVKTDIWTVHDYERDPERLVKNHTFVGGRPVFRNQPDKKFLAEYEGQPYMLDEFGGLPWIPQEERATSWGYGGHIDTLDDFYQILEREVDAIIACPHIVGYCYTQITDVEQEKNGLYRYDRTPKFDAARLKAIFSKIPSVIQNPTKLK